MKHLMYLSVSILCLSLSLLIGFHLGVRTVDAQLAEPSPTGNVLVATETGTNRLLILNIAGEMWALEGSGWRRITALDPLPVPASEIKYWSEYSLITYADEGWYWDGFQWRSGGSVPVSTTSVDVEPTTWGKLKSQY